MPFVALGAGLLWFGWFGFNAGSELTADGITAVAFINTQVATAAALLGWVLVEWIKNGKPTLVGASSGAVAGLVAITPACAFITPVCGGAARCRRRCRLRLAVGLKYGLRFDDSLDVVGIHFVGGWIGYLLIGFFGNNPFLTNDAGEPYVGGNEGLFYGGGATQLVAQAHGAAIVSRVVVRGRPGHRSARQVHHRPAGQGGARDRGHRRPPAQGDGVRQPLPAAVAAVAFVPRRGIGSTSVPAKV